MTMPDNIRPMIPGILNRFNMIGASNIINRMSEKIRTELLKGV